MNVIDFKNISRAYERGILVLDGVSFSIAEGEVVGLLGRNGAGKTTLIRIAMGMLYPQRGEVRVFGMDPEVNPVEIKRRVGYVSEDQVLPPHSSVQEMISFHKMLFAKWDAQLEKQLVDRFALPRGKKIKDLSKGQARQVALLCAVCHRPELLVLDEPAGGLDPISRREFLETSVQLLNDGGTTILFSSHHMGDVERMAGRVVMIDHARVRIDSDLDKLREELCVALVPLTSGKAEDVAAVPGCMHTRIHAGSVHAVFRGEPNAVERAVVAKLGANNVRCSRVPLEEMFIELVEER